MLQDAAAVVQVVGFDSVVLRVALHIVEVAAAAPGRRVACVVQQILQAACAIKQLPHQLTLPSVCLELTPPSPKGARLLLQDLAAG